MYEYAVVGSGVGGSSMAAYLNAKGKNVILFEKEPYLGGCSSTFSHKGFKYNTGATTLAGYENDFIVKEVFDAIGFKPNIIETDPTIVIKQNSKTTPRYKDFEKFLTVLEENYPHPKNREFWTLVYRLNKKFYTFSGHYYSNKTLLKKISSLLSFLPLALEFKKYITVNSYSFIDTFFDGISKEYLQFLESQILIVAQAPTKDINFLTAALSLGYTFNENHYVVGGFSDLFDEMTQNIKNLHRSSEITHIEKAQSFFILHTKEKSFHSKKIILNSTVYDSAKLFNDTNIQNYFKPYEKLDNHQGSFMLYMTIKSEENFAHHYQLIQKEPYPYTVSNALFVSFSDKSDNTLAPEGYYSITASIHTDNRLWSDKKMYKKQKQMLKEQLLATIMQELEIEDSQIIESFTATPKTFKSFINRSQLGGNAITMKNFLPKLPSNDTRIEGLYSVGDTVYAAQGWPGVMLGVKNLQRLLHV